MVGPSISQLVHHSRVQTIEVPVTTSEIIVGQQQITIDDGADEVISGDITEGTPINITLQDGRLPEGTALSVSILSRFFHPLKLNSINNVGKFCL